MLRLLMLACFLCAACGGPSPVREPTKLVAGKSYAQWTATWWQWAFNQPATNHPLVYDQTGDYCATGQPDQAVFFLGSTFGGNAARQCSVPADVNLLFPIAVTEVHNLPTDMPQRTTDQLVAAAKASIDSVSSLSAELDGEQLVGREVAQFAGFRQSVSFRLTIPDNADNILRKLFGIDYAGTLSPVVTDGYWIALRPLPTGSHVLKFSTSLTSPMPFSSGVEYHLNVQ